MSANIHNKISKNNFPAVKKLNKVSITTQKPDNEHFSANINNHDVPAGYAVKSILDTSVYERKLSKINGFESEEKNPETVKRENLVKRARAKYITQNLARKLADLNSPLKKSYWRSYYCASVLEQDGDKVKAKYCNSRWCLVCNRIRTARLIEGYEKPISELKDKRFVTLTNVNVSDQDLRSELKMMKKTFSQIADMLRKRKTPMVGIRKTETTYSLRLDNFNPHFHLIVSGRDIADEIVNQWLKRFPNADREAQDNQPADDNSIMELFKYVTKFYSADKKMYVQALDVIFCAMHRMKTYETYGGIKKVSEEVEELVAENIDDLPEEVAQWVWVKSDWVNSDTGEYLTGYVPEDWVEEIISNIRGPT